MTPEGLVKRKVGDYLKTRTDLFFFTVRSAGVYDPIRKCFRGNSDKFYVKGVSDFIGIDSTGKFFAIELKSKKGYPTQDQKTFIAKINSMGGTAFIARSVEDVVNNLPVAASANTSVGF